LRSERKAEGEEVVAAVSEEPTPTKAPDLMAALEESLAAVKGESLGGDGKRKPAAKRSAPAKSRSKGSSNGRKSTSKSGSSKSKPSSRSQSKAKAGK
jgi:hypothetical protein